MGWTRLRVLKALINWHYFSGLGAKKTVKQTLYVRKWFSRKLKRY